MKTAPRGAGNTKISQKSGKHPSPSCLRHPSKRDHHKITGFFEVSNYVLVDDHVGLGGTLANLRGYVEARGGEVIAITTLTESRDARIISLQHATRIVLWQRHGQALDDLWQSQFGYGIDCLTEVEALNLCRQHSVAAIEDFLAQAAVEARGRGLQTAVEPGD